MFYGTESFETAMLETFDPLRAKGKLISGSCFQPLNDLRVLDLVNLPAAPGYFAIDEQGIRDPLLFLHQFVTDVVRPIQRDGREHIEYVPTQVFTEFVRWELTGSDDIKFDGLRYRSSRNGDPCIVLFCDHEQCLEQAGKDSWNRVHQVLQFDRASIKTIKPGDVQK